jgi:hypothetical protein
MAKEIKITSSKGNSTHLGREIFWVWVNGAMLRKSNGVGRTFRTEAAARKAGERE